MIQEEGIPTVRNAVVAVLSKGVFGTDNTTVTKNDGGVLAPIASTELALNEKTVSGHQIKTKHVVPTTTANGLTFAEHEIELSDGTSLTRNTFNTFSKTDNIAVHAFTVFTLNP